jgi:hypothetical protein
MAWRERGPGGEGRAGKRQFLRGNTTPVRPVYPLCGVMGRATPGWFPGLLV